MNMLSREAAPFFNAALGGVAAAAAAFFVFAMPHDLFASLVGAIGIDLLIPAAQPPLGFTARVAAMAFAAGAIFFGIWTLLRKLDALQESPQAAPGASEGSSALLPRLRRADAHPDAPARRPLLAGHELGEPGEPAQSDEASAAEESPDVKGFEAEQFADEAFESGPQATADDALGGQPTVSEPDWSASVRPDPAVGIESGGQPEREVLEDRDSLMARLPLPEDRGDSISVLFRRLDEGLANCEWPLGSSPVARDDASKQTEDRQDPVGDQLRSALDDLRKMAGGA